MQVRRKKRAISKYGGGIEKEADKERRQRREGKYDERRKTDVEKGLEEERWVHVVRD